MTSPAASVHEPDRVAELETRLLGIESRLDDLDTAVGDSLPATPAERRDEPPEPYYRSVEAWVADYFSRVYVRPIGGPWRWCPRWWDHAEALTRLEALWRAWETLRLDTELGIATWLTHHLDAQLPVLCGQAGPFARCSPDRHDSPSPLPVEPAPQPWPSTP